VPKAVVVFGRILVSCSPGSSGSPADLAPPIPSHRPLTAFDITRQAKGLVVALFVAGFAVALLDR
jgi:hypothetical protein